MAIPLGRTKTQFTIDGQNGEFYCVINELAHYPQVVWTSYETRNSWRAMRWAVRKDRLTMGYEFIYHYRKAYEVFTAGGERDPEQVPADFRALAALVLEDNPGG